MRRTAAIAWRKQSPWPVSLPMDHNVTDTLLRWKIAFLSLRSTIERSHSGKRPSPSFPYPGSCASTFASATT